MARQFINQTHSKQLKPKTNLQDTQMPHSKKNPKRMPTEAQFDLMTHLLDNTDADDDDMRLSQSEANAVCIASIGQRAACADGDIDDRTAAMRDRLRKKIKQRKQQGTKQGK